MYDPQDEFETDFESNAEKVTKFISCAKCLKVLSQINPNEVASGRRSSIGLASLKAKRDKLFTSLRTEEMSKVAVLFFCVNYQLIRRQSFQALLSPGRALSRSTSVRHYEKPTNASAAKTSTPVKASKKDALANKENKKEVNKENKKVLLPLNILLTFLIAG
jgi:hypothetical protein